VTRRAEIRVPGRPELSHSADAVRADDVLFVAGVLPVDAEGRLVGGDDVVEQAGFTFAELGRILTAAGATYEDVAKVTVFLTDVSDQPKVDLVRQEVFGSARPASTLVEVTGLAVPGAKIEVDAVVALP
jgi:2-iminobutanoate/2-iminopropanoate deaminase